MDWVTSTVSAFGQSVGIGELQLDESGWVMFRLADEGRLAVHDLSSSGRDEVLVMLAKPLPSPPAVSARHALVMADFRNNPTWQTQVSVRGRDLVVTLRMPRHSFLLNALEDAVETLFNFHNRVTEAH